MPGVHGRQLRFIESRLGAGFQEGNDSHRENNLDLTEAGLGSVVKGRTQLERQSVRKPSSLHNASVNSPVLSGFRHLDLTIMATPSGRCFLASDTRPLPC